MSARQQTEFDKRIGAIALAWRQSSAVASKHSAFNLGRPEIYDAPDCPRCSWDRALWGVRGILLTGVTAFPIGIDYAILNFFYLLVGMLLIYKLLKRYLSVRRTWQG